MVEVTENAKQELKRILQTQSLEPGKHLRLATPPVWVGDGDFGVVVDEQRDGDHEVQHQGVTLLLVDEALMQHMAKAVMDFKQSPEGPRFTLDVY